MYYDDHNPPHIHVEFQHKKAIFDFNGNVIMGNLDSKTATKLTREWINVSESELEKDWELARSGEEIKKIEPLK